VYKPLAPVEQNDLEFLIPGNTDTYIDLDIKIYVRGKMVSSSGKDVDLTDTTAVANNLLHSLFIQSSVMLTAPLSHNRTSIIIIVPILSLYLSMAQMLPHHIFLTVICTLITVICSLAIPRQRSTLPPQTTDS
jgi:hypothetical protein